jgi:EpsI family protein
MLRRRSILLSLVLLAAVAAYMALWPPRRIAGTHLDACPPVLAGMPGTPLTLEQAVLDDLDPDDYLLRRYDRPGGLPVWLVIVYFQNARLGAHDPQLCYRSQGFALHDLPSRTLDTGLGPVPCRVFRAAKAGRDELVYYFWYTAGGTAFAEVKGWRDRMFFQGLRKNRSFGAFVRVSTLEGEDARTNQDAVEDLIRDLAPRMRAFFPEDGTKGEESR